ncbi:DUF7503 family protein [Halalkalicoccus tibetensis]|uniref:Uncharacterized protein n=1 Tax=Halalkalicoccus tibetensis TaxID=175632 RepID=A0ABD5V6E5_9EURY
MSNESIKTYLANHPRMTGVLFTALLLLTQAGNAAASHAVTTAGP